MNSHSTPVPHRAAIKWLFAAVLLYMPLQYVIVAEFGEPYPALTMPPFSGTVTDANGVMRAPTVEVRVLCDDDSTVWISKDSLLADAPGSHRDAITYSMFSPVRPAKAAVVPGNGLKQRIKKAVLPGLVWRYEKVASSNPDPRTIEWLKRRLRELVPGRVPKSATFVWYSESYRPSPSGVERSRVETGTYEVHFDAAE